ncbi:Protein RseC [Pseudoalteromonas holothuriae]|uniref:Protein RseC n=1 Tax=Pseudoalteromonas holothuriae TaxID=2963714 RepID=A0A9W4QS21_9GAMM|nr:MULTISPECIES: SoxR reducing system RseC family protein [unclassified Pseudoalteromonas]CAH9050705.1 Protein RseC [Pseudoalteromonas sp. CIP111854]CAH9059704.1 Protein RseC [Pseudoalteromonas sp. CIP111951]
MIEQTLTVVSVSGTTAHLQAQQKVACEGCNGKCGSQVFSKLFGTHKKTFPITIEESLQVGQKVKLSLDDSKIVNHAFYVYMFPLIFAFIFVFMSALILNLGEPWQIFAALIGGCLGIFVARKCVYSLKHDVKVVKIYPISMAVTQIDGD